jgi:hypothetical protein
MSQAILTQIHVSEDTRVVPRKRTEAVYVMNESGHLDWRITPQGDLFMSVVEVHHSTSDPVQPKVREITVPFSNTTTSDPYCVRPCRSRSNSFSKSEF